MGAKDNQFPDTTGIEIVLPREQEGAGQDGGKENTCKWEKFESWKMLTD